MQLELWLTRQGGHVDDSDFVGFASFKVEFGIVVDG